MSRLIKINTRDTLACLIGVIKSKTLRMMEEIGAINIMFNIIIIIIYYLLLFLYYI